MAPNTPFAGRNAAESWRQAQALPDPAQLVAFIPAHRPALSRRVVRVALGLLLMLAVLLAGAAYFFLFGEERPERVRPELTPAQRARAFRLPNA